MDVDPTHGGIDLNLPAEEEDFYYEFHDNLHASSAEAHRNGETADVHGSATAAATAGPSGSGTAAATAGPSVVDMGNNSDTAATFGSGVPTGETVPTEDSGSDGEVDSTPEGFRPRTPFVGMKFESSEAAKIHYNRYAKHIGFSMKVSTSRRSVLDNELDKALFICNKAGKNPEKEGDAEPVKLRMRSFTKQFLGMAFCSSSSFLYQSPVNGQFFFAACDEIFLVSEDLRAASYLVK